jgi:hypothetical protein
MYIDTHINEILRYEFHPANVIRPTEQNAKKLVVKQKELGGEMNIYRQVHHS